MRMRKAVNLTLADPGVRHHRDRARSWRTNGQPRRQLDVTRAAEQFGFRARVGLREGLEQTIAWYRASGLHGSR